MIYTTPTMKKGSEYFENKSSPPKEFKHKVNTYPVVSIFEFMSKLNKLILNNIEEGKKVYIDFKNPGNSSSRFYKKHIENRQRGESLAKVFLTHKKIYSCFLLLGHNIENSIRIDKFFTLEETKLFDNNFVLNNNRMFAPNNISTLLIKNRKQANLLKRYLSKKLISTKYLNCILSIRSIEDQEKIKDLPISLNFYENNKIKILLDEISEDSVLITWGINPWGTDSLGENCKKTALENIAKINTNQDKKKKSTELKNKKAYVRLDEPDSIEEFFWDLD